MLLTALIKVFSVRFGSNYQINSDEVASFQTLRRRRAPDNSHTTMNEIAFHTSPVINSKRPLSVPKGEKSSECQRLLPPSGFLSLLHSFPPSLSISHSVSPDTSRSVRSGCFSPRYSAIPPSSYSSPSQPSASPLFISDRGRERGREREGEGDRDRERKRGRREPVPLRKSLRCRPAGLNPASAPRGPSMCASAVTTGLAVGTYPALKGATWSLVKLVEEKKSVWRKARCARSRCLAMPCCAASSGVKGTMTQVFTSVCQCSGLTAAVMPVTLFHPHV